MLLLVLLLHGGGFAVLRSQQRPQLHMRAATVISCSIPNSAACSAPALLCSCFAPFSSGIANPAKPIFSNGPRPCHPCVPGPGRWQAAPAGVAPSCCRTRRELLGVAGPESESRRPKLKLSRGALAQAHRSTSLDTSGLNTRSTSSTSWKTTRTLALTSRHSQRRQAVKPQPQPRPQQRAQRQKPQTARTHARPPVRPAAAASSARIRPGLALPRLASPSTRCLPNVQQTALLVSSLLCSALLLTCPLANWLSARAVLCRSSKLSLETNPRLRLHCSCTTVARVSQIKGKALLPPSAAPLPLFL